MNRRQKLILRRNKKKSVIPLILKIIIPVLIILGIFIFLKIDTKYWNGTDKLSYVSVLNDGNVTVAVLDPKLNEQNTFIIPGSSEVNVAGNFGTLKIGNVWQLGVDEKLGGLLLAETVTKNFLMPTFLWSSADGKSTNIPLGDKLAIKLFLLQVKSVDKTVIDLGKSEFLKHSVLSDGSMGYVLEGPISERITAYFADNDFADESLRVGIDDATGVPGSADTVGQIVQILGGKVVSVDKEPVNTSLDCAIAGVDAKIVRKIANLFGCSTSVIKSQFDLEIRLGVLFAKRY